MINNSRADHIHKLLSLTEKFKDTASVLEDPEGSSNPQPFKKKKSAFSRYEAMSTQIQPKEVKETSLLEFKHVDTLGKGAFGAVYLVEHEITKKRYAMKMLSKAQIEAQKLQRYALTERKILATINHPFVVKLHYAFQTYDKLIFVMDYCPGGDLLDIIKKYKKLDEQLVKKYAAEIVLALECLHKAEIIYRDLKPANVVIDKDGHACLTDFGLAKEADMTHSFCGSLAYLSPEMLSRRGHTRTLDWYLLGVLIYECYTGKPPFYDTNKSELLNNIKVGRYKPFEASAEMKDIVAKVSCS